jgi:hypothetical protein
MTWCMTRIGSCVLLLIASVNYSPVVVVAMTNGGSGRQKEHACLHPCVSPHMASWWWFIWQWYRSPTSTTTRITHCDYLQHARPCDKEHCASNEDTAERVKQESAKKEPLDPGLLLMIADAGLSWFFARTSSFFSLLCRREASCQSLSVRIQFSGGRGAFTTFATHHTLRSVWVLSP